MTEKRFTFVDLSETWAISVDNECKYYMHLVDNCTTVVELLNSLSDENEQLKEDNKILIRLLENQSIIIQKLHSKILEYQLKEPIVLTKEDLEIMGKAISYYTHGRCPE